MKRLNHRLGLALLMTVCALTVVAISRFSVPSAAERMIVSYFAKKGVTVTSVKVASYTDSELVIRDLGIGEDVKLHNLTLRYVLRELVEGQIRSIELEGLTLAVTKKNNAWAVTSLAPMLGGADDDAVPLFERVPVARIAAKNITVVVQPEKQPAVTYHADAAEMKYSREKHQLEFDMVRLAHISATPYFTPLSGNVALGEAGEGLTLAGILSDESGVLKAKIGGALSADGAPQVLNMSSRISFTPEMQPAKIFPPLKGKLPVLTGGVTAAVSIDRQKDFVPHAAITMHDLNLQKESVSMEKINGTIALTSLSPPVTDGTQALMVGKLVAGVPVESGVMRFRLAPNGALTLLPTSWRWLGGSLSSEQQTFDIRNFSLEALTLQVRDIPLAALLSLALKEGLSADGTVSGRLPLRLTDGKVSIRQGHMASGGEGVIRYAPGDAAPLRKGQNAQTDLLLKALENFHFTLLNLTVDSERPDLVKLGLAIKGSNPDLYDGKPIELNVNLNGDIFGLVSNGLKSYQLPATIEKKLNDAKN